MHRPVSAGLLRPQHWAMVTTVKLNEFEPLAWLTDVLKWMIPGRAKVHEFERLLPWRWKAKRLTAIGR